MYFELGLISVIVAGGYWGFYYLRRRQSGVLFGALLMLAVVFSALGLLGRGLDNGVLSTIGAIGVGGGACMLVIGPALRSFARRFAAAERYVLASRMLDLADILAPGSGIGEDKALLGAMREIRDGHIEQTVDALTAAKTGAPAEARLAIDERIAMLYLAAYRWEEGIAHAEAFLWPAIPAAADAPKPAEPSVSTPVALRRTLGLAPPVWVELVGAYGRTGDLDRAAGMLARLEDACAGRADASVWVHRARLMFLALAGRVAAVEELTAAKRARHMGVAARTYWRGVAHERHGETAAATAAYAKARDKARGKSRELVDQAIAKLPTATAATLGPKASEVIARVEAAPVPKLARGRRATGPIATWSLTGIVVAVTVLTTVLLGPTGDPGVLLRAGAMMRTQIDAGEWWRVISCVFVHIGFAHMLLDAITLWMIGRICEELLGSVRTLVIFLLAGIAGGAISYVASSGPVSSGASGGVLGLLGAVFVELVLHPRHYLALRKRDVWSAIAIVAVAELGFGLLFPVVEQWAHGAGFATGVVLAAALSPHGHWGKLSTHVARGLAVIAVALTVYAGVMVVRTSVVDSLTGVPMRAWQLDGVTIDAPAAWARIDDDLADEDIFFVVSVASYQDSHGRDADLAAWVASEPARAAISHFDQIAPATERVVPLPLGWEGSELEASYEDPLGDRKVYRVVVAARELAGRVVLARIYAPDSIAREAPEILTGILGSAR